MRAERGAPQCTLGLDGEEKRVKGIIEFREFERGKGGTEDRVDRIRCQRRYA